MIYGDTTVTNKHPLLRLLPLLLPLLLLLPGLAAFPYPSADAPYSDLTISHYPNAIYLKRALLEYQQVPLWSPTILSGYPFAANPLSGLWYPPGWLALLLPLPFGFNLMALLHLLLGGAGMYLLLRARGLAYPAGLLGGMAFEALPKLFAHYGAGHLTLIYAVPWTPWLLLAVDFTPVTRWGRWFQPGVIWALIFLADPRWAAYAGLLWLGREIACGAAGIIDKLARLLKQVGLAALLAAPLALPLLRYVRLSTRAQLTPEDVFDFSLPPARLLGLAFPDFSGNQEWITYAGAMVFALALLAIVWSRGRREAKFWVWVAGLSLVYALGEFVPGLSVLAQLPGFSLLRVPARALFLVGMALAVLAGYAVDHLLTGLSTPEERRTRLMLFSLAGFGVVMALLVWIITGEISLNFAWGAGALLASTVWLGLGLSHRLPSKVWLVGLFVLCLVDWAVVNQSLFAPRPTVRVLSQGAETVEYLAARPGLFRVYSPSYSLPQQTAAFYGLELADGVDPLQLEAYAEYMEQAIGVPRSGYSVTLPQFEQGDPVVDNRDFLPDPLALSWLNVRYVAAEFDLAVEGLTLVRRFGHTRLYENQFTKPRAWVQPVAETKDSTLLPANVIEWTPNRIVVEAEGPGVLVLTEIAYPGWRVWVDEVRADAETAVMDLLRGVALGEGRHTVAFVYQPVEVYLGLSLAVSAILGLLLWPQPKREAAGS